MSKTKPNVPILKSPIQIELPTGEVVSVQANWKFSPKLSLTVCNHSGNMLEPGEEDRCDLCNDDIIRCCGTSYRKNKIYHCKLIAKVKTADWRWNDGECPRCQTRRKKENHKKMIK